MKQAVILTIAFILLVPSAFAKDSNPDGIIGKPVIILLGGFRTGGGELTLWQNMYPIKQENMYPIKRDGDFSSFGLLGKIICPTSKHLSLTFQISGDWQKINYPETSKFFRQESRFGIYSFVFGFRIFTQ